MALTNLIIYNQQVYRMASEMYREIVNLFNAASANAIRLIADPIQGSFHEAAFFAQLENIIRHRDPFSNGPIDKAQLAMLAETMVKVARGTKEIDLSTAEMQWIKKDPAVLASQTAKAIAHEMLKDKLETTILALKAAIGSQSEVTYNSPVPISWRVLNRGQFRFGDARQLLRVSVMHSLALEDLYDSNLQNMAHLFTFEGVNVMRDPFGRLLLAVDLQSLINEGSEGVPSSFDTLMLTQDAALCAENNDWEANEETKNGFENIITTYQAQWSYNVKVKGFSYNKAQGANPSKAILGSAAAWDRTVTDKKNLPGVLVKTPARDLDADLVGGDNTGGGTESGTGSA